jgi:CheY-like chemotaxis protein
VPGGSGDGIPGNGGCAGFAFLRLFSGRGLAKCQLNHPARLVGLRLLAVDDDRDSLDLITAILADSGAEVRASRSAAEALKVVEEWRPDIVISDIEMPGEDGYAFIQKTRRLEAASGRRAPAIALTAYGRPEDRERATSVGYDIHVPKPVESAELVTIVASLAGRWSDERRGMNRSSIAVHFAFFSALPRRPLRRVPRRALPSGPVALAGECSIPVV